MTGLAQRKTGFVTIMTAAAFDTLRLARALREKAKFTPEQAEGLADAMAEAMQGDIATKADIEGLKAAVDALKHSTRADIEASSSATKADIVALSSATKAEFDAQKAATKAEFDAQKAATKAEFDAHRAATKIEFDAQRNATSVEFLAVRSEARQAELRFEAKLEAAKADIIKWMFGTIGFQTIIVLGAAIALARLALH
jgi:hypothetical protein